MLNKAAFEQVEKKFVVFFRRGLAERSVTAAASR